MLRPVQHYNEFGKKRIRDTLFGQIYVTFHLITAGGEE